MTGLPPTSPPRRRFPASTALPLLAALRIYFNRRGIEANWDSIDGMTDETLVITLAMACPFEPAEKQALLEAPTPADRAAALAILLQIDIHATGTDCAPARSRAS